MIAPLLDLDVASLKALAAAFQRGELDEPTALNLKAYCPVNHVPQLLAALNEAKAKGLSRSAFAVLIQTLVADRERRSEQGLKADLVWSGPDLAGDYTRDTRVVVHELFRKARKQVLVSTFSLYQGEELFAPLHETMLACPELQVSLYLDIARGDKELPENQLLEQFCEKFHKSHWPWKPVPKVYYDPRSLKKPGSPERASLHAKTVVVDGREVFLTSANLTEAGQQRNIEAGLLLKSPAIAEQLAYHFDALVKHGHLKRLEL